MRFYRCPLGDISCPGSSKICYETNKPPLVCDKDTALPACLKCRAAESAERAAANAAAEKKLQDEADEASLTEDITAPDATADSDEAVGRRLNLGYGTGRRKLALVGNLSAINATNGGNLGASEVAYAYAANGNTNAMCSLGYEGPMCNKCVNGHWKTPADTCERCKTSVEDSQRGDVNLQMYIYVGGGTTGMVFVLIALGLYLRQDGGACLCAPCAKCLHTKKCSCHKNSNGSKVIPSSTAKHKINESVSIQAKLVS